MKHKQRYNSTLRLPRRTKGQSMVLVALMMMVLIGFVGLAVDGGSWYMQRRSAQNGTDAAAMAGTREMLDLYEDAQWGSGGTVQDGSSDEEQQILSYMQTAASANNVLTSTLTGYFVNDNKQAVTNKPVGQNGYVPWSLGATGIAVTGQAQTDTYFIRILGFNSVKSSATATGFMGVATGSGITEGLFPVGFFTNTMGLNNLVEGQTYVLIDGDSRYTSGNWGYINFNGQTSGSASLTQAWMDCGYAPWIMSDNEWSKWCTRYSNQQHAAAPTQYWLDNNGSPGTGPLYDTTGILQWGASSSSHPGWWLSGSSGSTRSNCEDLATIINDTVHHNPPIFLLPVFDAWTGTGSNTKFHLLAFQRFLITDGDVDCHATDPVTKANYQHWHIEGQPIMHYVEGANGQHGDIYHTTMHTIFLEP